VAALLPLLVPAVVVVVVVVIVLLLVLLVRAVPAAHDDDDDDDDDADEGSAATVLVAALAADSWCLASSSRIDFTMASLSSSALAARCPAAVVAAHSVRRCWSRHGRR